MNNFIKFLCGTAAATMMFSCSSDEPANVPGDDNVSADGVAYLAVNIKDATSSRALVDDIEEGNEGNYIYGDAVEHNVDNAHFYFYDANGIFVTEANVWTGGKPGTTENIEYIGDNVLVLRNLKGNNMPNYLVTVLNVPADFKPSPRLEDMAKQQLLSYLSGNSFIMSTTSFINEPAVDSYEAKDKKLYFANKLKATDFSKEPIASASDAVTKVNIYVERLAAKFTNHFTQKPDADGFYTIPVTIAGNPNGNIGGEEPGTGVGATNMYIKFDGWAVNATEPTSYLSKNLDDFWQGNPLKKGDGSDWEWNKHNYFRSFWGQSVQYGKTPVLNYTTWNNAAKKAITEPLYSFECTNQPKYIANGMNVITKNVTHVVFAATVYSSKTDKDGESLVLYNGVYYKKNHFLQYVLNSLQKSGNLNYYIKVSDTEYRQVGVDEVTLALRTDDAKGTGKIIVTTNLPEGTKLYSKNAEGKFEELANADGLKAALEAFVGSVEATAFTSGKMVYYIPIEHLVEILTSQKELVEGNYGVVRNHWYDLTINKVIRLGEGVFDPENEKLIPENPNGDTYGLGARVNILSWKIVKQSVDL